MPWTWRPTRHGRRTRTVRRSCRRRRRGRSDEIAAQARSRGIAQTVLLLLTDGRANVGLRAQRGGLEEELQQLGRQVAAAGIQTLVIDTQRSYLSRGEARRLAEWLAGEYIYLPQASGDHIAALALAATR